MEKVLKGTVTGLWRFPVKSMGGEQLEEAELTEAGILGDRAYALIEKDTGKVVSAKSVKSFPDLFQFKAAFVEPPRRGCALPPVLITFPDGTLLRSDSDDADEVLSAHFGRAVTLGQTAPDDYTIDQYHSDIEGADPFGRKDEVVEQKLGAALFTELGMESPVPAGSFFDVFPLSILTTSTLAQLKEHQPESQFDERRFRMNVIVETEESGFIENNWIGQDLTLGDSVALKVAMPGPRCIMTILEQDDLPRDPAILKTLVNHNRIQVGDLGKFPCAGVYAVVLASGSVRLGDSVSLD